MKLAFSSIVISKHRYPHFLRRHYISKIITGILLPLPALAVNGNDKLETAITGISNYITGPLGSSLCTLAIMLAIMGTGFLWLKTGHLEKEQAVGTMLGIGLIYSAGYIVTTVMGIGN
jgi:type IV secretory pathway VirB2 component (pilin)